MFNTGHVCTCQCKMFGGSLFSVHSVQWFELFRGSLLLITSVVKVYIVYSGVVKVESAVTVWEHTRLMALFPGLPGWAGKKDKRKKKIKKGKTSVDFTEARDSEWQWHPLGHMQVCTALQTDNHASTPPLSFYRPDALPAAQPTASKLRCVEKRCLVVWQERLEPRATSSCFWMLTASVRKAGLSRCSMKYTSTGLSLLMCSVRQLVEMLLRQTST